MGKPVKKLTEAEIKAQIFLEIGARRDVMVWNNAVGVATPIGTTRKVKFGSPGAPDILGIQMRRVHANNVVVMETVNPNSMQPLERPIEWFYGQALAIEVKTAVGRQREQQKHWQHAWESTGGVYILARSVEDVLQVIGRQPDDACVERSQEIWDAVSQEQWR